jgi:hypothetical protein
MRVSAFIEPCLPSPADRPPSGQDWIHEIKLDGFRMMVRRDPAGVRLITRNGHDWSGRFPLIAEAAGALRAWIMIYGPKPDGTYVVEFKIADGEALAISVAASETRVLKYFQDRMPYGLFVPDAP